MGREYVDLRDVGLLRNHMFVCAFNELFPVC